MNQLVIVRLCHCLILLSSCHTQTRHEPDSGTLNLPPAKIDNQVPLSEETRKIQDKIKALGIESAFCYSRRLDSKDTFKLYEIRNYDVLGRLRGIYNVNRTIKDTTVKKIFIYSTNGVLLKTQLKTVNNGETFEYFLYNKEGRLISSHFISPYYSDTFHFRRSNDTLYKFHMINGMPSYDNADIKVFNKEGLIVKEVQRYPTITPYEIVSKSYKKNFPLPVKEVYYKHIIHPMEYKLEYKFRF